MKHKKIRYSTVLEDLYGKEDYKKHLEVGREYWWYWPGSSDVFEHTHEHWTKIKITFERSGVYFYVLPDYPDFTEHFFPVDCFLASHLQYAEIDPMKDLVWDNGVNNELSREYLEKRYYFSDEKTVVLNWDNSPESEIDESDMTMFDMIHHDISMRKDEKEFLKDKI